MIIAVTGHRPPKVGGYYTPNRVYDAIMLGLRTLFELHNPEQVITGMALGVDQWAAELCVALDIPFIAAIPFRGYSAPWPLRSKQHFEELCRRASDVIYTSDATRYSPMYLHQRNAWMVDNADRVVGVWNGQEDGGTSSCLTYARRVHKPIDLVELPADIWDYARDIELQNSTRRGQRQQQQEVRNQQQQMAMFPNLPLDPIIGVDPAVPNSDQTVTGQTGLTLFNRRVRGREAVDRQQETERQQEQRFIQENQQRAARYRNAMNQLMRDNQRAAMDRQEQELFAAMGVPAEFLNPPQPEPHFTSDVIPQTQVIRPTPDPAAKVQDRVRTFQPGRKLDWGDE